MVDTKHIISVHVQGFICGGETYGCTIVLQTSSGYVVGSGGMLLRSPPPQDIFFLILGI